MLCLYKRINNFNERFLNSDYDNADLYYKIYQSVEQLQI